MKQQNRETLDKYRILYTIMVNAQTIRGLPPVLNELMAVMQEEFIPGYVIVQDCGQCLFDFLRIIYQRYDEWLAKNPDPVEPTPELIPDETGEQVTVHTGFPSNKEESGEPIIIKRRGRPAKINP